MTGGFEGINAEGALIKSTAVNACGAAAASPLTEH